MWTAIGAAAIGGLIVLAVPRLLSAVRLGLWKRHTPEGRGYARIEQIVGQLLERVPGEIIVPDPPKREPYPRRQSRRSQIAVLVGFALVAAGLYEMTRGGSDHNLGAGAIYLAAMALFFSIFLAVSLEKRIDLIRADLRRIADAVAPTTVEPVAFRYQLRNGDGDDLGEASYSVPVNAGDTIHINGTQRVRVTAVIPEELAAEFVDGAAYGVLQVEPL